MLTAPRHHHGGERGVILITGVFGLLVLLAMGALIVDILRAERIGRSLQRAADAAALAGALELRGDPYAGDGDLAGWREAKRAAVLALRGNPIAEEINPLTAGSTGWSSSGITDHWESDAAGNPTTPYAHTVISIGKLRITIERGAWLYDEDSADFDSSVDGPFFQPLESTDGRCPEFWETENNYLRANAVRVRIQNESIRSFFPLSWAGAVQFGALSREAVASAEDD